MNIIIGIVIGITLLKIKRYYSREQKEQRIADKYYAENIDDGTNGSLKF